MEPAADVIAHAAHRHRAKGVRRHQERRLRCNAFGQSPGVLAEQEQQLGWPGELRRVAKSAVAPIERHLELLDADIRASLVATPASLLEPVLDFPSVPVTDFKRSSVPVTDFKPIEQLRSCGVDFRGIVAPDTGQLRKQIDKPWTAPSRGGRKVRTAVERPEVRREEHAHRPPSRSGGGLHERHVDPIDVGPLLPIDLDRDEVAVQRLGDLLALERLVLHHVAPVARRVADRQEDGLPLLAGPRESLLSPRVPIDRVACMLQQVGAAFAGEAVHLLPSYGKTPPTSYLTGPYGRS